MFKEDNNISLRASQVKKITDPSAVYKIFFNPGEVTEVRAFGLYGKNKAWEGYAKDIVYGYFNNPDAFCKAVKSLDEQKASRVHFTLNPSNPALIARAQNRLKANDSKSSLTTDKDVIKVRWLPIDLDPAKPTGISSTGEELNRALELREIIAKWLKEEFDIIPGIFAMSGNGAHLLVRIEDSKPEIASPIIKDALKTIAHVYPSTNTGVEVDQSVYNPARIWKAYGTTVRKGDNTEDRPHRQAYIFDTGVKTLDDVPINEIEKIKKLADSFISENKKTFYIAHDIEDNLNNKDGANVDLDKFLNDYQDEISVLDVKDLGDDVKMYRLEECLFANEHTTKTSKGDSGFIVFPNGKVIYHCFHSHCQNKTVYDALKKLAGESYKKYVLKKKKNNDSNKGKKRKLKTSEILIKIANEQAEFFHTPNERKAFARVKINEHYEVYSIRSSEFKQWLGMKLFETEGRVPSSNALAEAVDILEGFAKFKGKQKKVFLRVAEDKENKKIYIDLGNDNWEVIEVSEEGWRVLKESPVMFIRTKGMLPLPYPSKEKRDITLLKNYLNIESNEDFILIVAWLLYAYRYNSGYPILALFASEGTGKSTTSFILKSLIDPKEDDLKTLPSNERNLAVTSKNSWVSVFDNLSHIPDWLSDAFCRLSTGGTIAVRKLYTDEEEEYFKLTRPLIINGITEVITRNDLADRAIAINLPYIPEDKRKDEGDFKEQFNNDMPYILGGLLDALAEGLRNIENVKIKKLPRMANFAKWICACEPALPWKQGEFLKAYNRNREFFIANSIETDTFTNAFLDWFNSINYFKGTAKELFEALKSYHKDNYDVINSKFFPKEIRGLGKKLRRIQSVLMKIGIEVNFIRSKKNRYIKIKRIGKEEDNTYKAENILKEEASEKKEEKEEVGNIEQINDAADKEKIQYNATSKVFSISNLVDTTPANEELANLI